MQAEELNEIFKRLTLVEKLQLLELFFKDVKEDAIKKESEENKRRKAAELLLSDYLNDSEFTAFTVLDGEAFYETK